MTIYNAIGNSLSIILNTIEPVYGVDEYLYPNKTMGNFYLLKC